MPDEDLNRYTKIHTVQNCDIVDAIAEADPTKFAVLKKAGDKKVYDVRLDREIKMYLDPPVS